MSTSPNIPLIPLIPNHTDLITHQHSTIGSFPKTTYLVTFIYPDCIRTFDGRNWAIHGIPSSAGEAVVDRTLFPTEN